MSQNFLTRPLSRRGRWVAFPVAVAALAASVTIGSQLGPDSADDDSAVPAQLTVHGIAISAVPGSEGQAVGMYQVHDALTGQQLPDTAYAYTTVTAAHAAAQAYVDGHPAETWQIVDPA